MGKFPQFNLQPVNQAKNKDTGHVAGTHLGNKNIIASGHVAGTHLGNKNIIACIFNMRKPSFAL